MERKYVLVKFQDNYGDEFDVDCFWTTSLESFNKFKRLLELEDIDEDQEFYFGTNEFVNFDSKSLLNNLEFYLLTLEEYNTFYKIFGKEWNNTNDVEYGLIDIVSGIIEYFRCANLENEESKEILNYFKEYYGMGNYV